MNLDGNIFGGKLPVSFFNHGFVKLFVLLEQVVQVKVSLFGGQFNLLLLVALLFLVNLN
jgi:hypothetical protein